MADDESDETVQVNHLVPTAMREKAKSVAGWGELSDAVRAAYAAFARSRGDMDVVRLEAEKHRLRVRLDAIDEQILSLEDERDQLAEREAELEQAISAAESEADEYAELVAELVAAVDRGESVWTTHATVQEAAEVKGCSRDAVIEDVRERRPDAPDDQFAEGLSSGSRFTATESENL